MLSNNIIQKQFQADETKINTLLDKIAKAPEKMRENTAHISTVTELVPYVYYTALVRQYAAKGAKVLDWGAYLGQITYLLQDDYDVTAYEPVENEHITYWHKELGIKKRDFNLDLSKVDGAPFDAIVSSGVLEHTFDFGVEDTQALKNLNAILKPGGYLFIWNLPTKRALAEKLRMYKHEWRHIVRYELEETLAKLALAGFEPVSVEVDEFLYYKFASLLPMHPLKVWRLDQKIARLPFLRRYSHHLTIVARKIGGTSEPLPTNVYTTYLT